jgi:Periplasmic protein TonB, links inner and outer membranes
MNPARLRLLLATVGVFLTPVFAAGASTDRSHLQAIQTTEPRFPPALIAQGITSGEAWIVLSVDADGRLTDALVSRYTHRALADEAMRLLRLWKFRPVVQNGEPVGVSTELRFRFEATGTLVSLDAMQTVEHLTRNLGDATYHKNIYTAAELDTPPTPTRRVSPEHPGSLRDQPARDYKAVLEFVIDETGRPRLPALVSAPHPEFANRAVEALMQWEFSPPLRDGKPVATRVRQEFIFPGS